MGRDRPGVGVAASHYNTHDNRVANADDMRRARTRCLSVTSFVGTLNEDCRADEDARSVDDILSHGLSVLLHPSRNDYPERKGKAQLHTPLGYVSDGELMPGKDALRRLKRKSRAAVIQERAGIETPRSFPTGALQEKKEQSGWLRQGLRALSSLMFDQPEANELQRMQTISEQHTELKNARLKLFAARAALDEQPRIVEQAVAQINKAGQPTTDTSPGAFSLYTHEEMERARLREGGGRTQLVVSEDENMAVQRLMFECRQNILLNEQLLYDPKYDTKWKTRYTDVILQEEGGKKKKPENRQGWVIPLRRICEKAGVDSKFFTHNRYVELREARAHVLYERLEMYTPASEWISSLHPEAARNELLEKYLSLNLDCRSMQTRVALFHHRLNTDRDRVRVHGQYYNNIYLGKRMFGPARKQKFVRTIVGGIERRFEILDNQVNHLPFTHHASDRNPDKCRNMRIKCRDDTRIVLRWPSGMNDSSAEEDSFIHANRIHGGPLFGRFIITQAPMPNTIDDFWRMVWQEHVPYIFMLISRKNKDRCTSYWPGKPTSPAMEISGGVRVENMGVDDYRDALFRVTYLRLTGPDLEERHVEHWQGDMNNVDNVASPLAVLRLARASSASVVVHDCLGVSRAASLIAAETAICSLLRGPTYKHTIQKAVHWVRSQRAFAVETPMQFVFIHRVVCHFFRPLLSQTKAFDADYKRWMEERAMRMFVDDENDLLPGYRQLSPRIDPDLLRLVRRRERPDTRREAHDVVGELPLPVDGPDVLAAKKRLPNKYPVGARYT